MSRFIWSDLHLGHANIIKYENRPFENADIMNKYLLTAWKETVKSTDEIWNLGDVAFKIPKVELQKIIFNLPGKKILVLGNHDRDKSVSWWRDVGFDVVYDKPIVLDDWFILSHEPLYVGPEMPYVNIHGHSHSESSTRKQKINVSVENLGYRPVSLDGIMEVWLDKFPKVSD